jgi:hypothetical protein
LNHDNDLAKHDPSPARLDVARPARHLPDHRQSLFGDLITIPLARVKAILVINKNTAGGYLLVGGAEADEWDAPFGASGDTVKVMPGSPLLLANAGEGWPVELGQSALRIAAADGNVTFDCAVLGTLPDEGASSSSPSSSSGA